MIARSGTTAAVALVGSAEESLYTEAAVARFDSFVAAPGQDIQYIAAVAELVGSLWAAVRIHWAAAGFAVAERMAVDCNEAAQGGPQGHLQDMSSNLRTYLLILPTKQLQVSIFVPNEFLEVFELTKLKFRPGGSFRV